MQRLLTCVSLVIGLAACPKPNYVSVAVPCTVPPLPQPPTLEPLDCEHALCLNGHDLRSLTLYLEQLDVWLASALRCPVLKVGK